MISSQAPPQVLIVGAGPTGLVLALQLARRGVPFRIIDNDAGPGVASRAIALHARTLEFYAQLGFADEVVARGIKMERIRLRRSEQGGGGQIVAELVLKDMGAGLSPYPFMLDFPQDDHEHFLVEKLATANIMVDWNVTLKAFTQSESGVRAVLDNNGQEEVCEVAYICGCDGARSQVRQTLKLDFPGGTYQQLFYVADVQTDAAYSPDGQLNVAEADFAFMMPVRSTGMHRLVGIVNSRLVQKPDLTFEDVRPDVEQLLRVEITRVNWFSTYHVHHRVAAKFRVGRAFIAGDAGHIHSPAGGQGMNTGIGDAVNLGWKLAHVLQGRAPDALLDTYEAERIPFARTLVATTDRAFSALAGGGLGSRLLRRWFIPHVLPFLTRRAAFRRLAFRTVSQIRINYRRSALSEGAAGRLQAGDRLPWVPAREDDNFAALTSMDWQVHVYGTAADGFRIGTGAANVAMHQYAWNQAAQDAGIEKNAVYLVRPDGHIALATPVQDFAVVTAYARRHALTLSGLPASR
jgi:2-polyprenyl-6-methoxyphenol hydroxylase-like FAD-dependent oxidoreductase